jgi:two-component system cell cycle sensor histidine kinase/response regulator CckA
MSEILQFLIVEDNADDAGLMAHELRRSGFKFEWQRVDTEAEYLAKLHSGLHLILSDYELPQFSGLRALQLLKQTPAFEIPFIIVSGAIGEEKAVAAMQQGAADYLLKDRLARLPAAVRGALKEVEDRRERKRLRAQFIEAQKMELIGQLAGSVAHDFNNVLAVIMGYSELLKNDLGPGHVLNEYIEEILGAGERAVGLTQQLLIFSRKQQADPVMLDLNEVVADTDKMLRRLVDHNVEMTMAYGSAIGQIKADSGYVWQVLMNLVVNARDAMPNGGRLAIETGSVTIGEAYAKTHPGTTPGDYAMLSVSDTGTGMTEEVKAHLFEAFFTTKPLGKGTGLGLITCRNIVQQCHGHIEVISVLEKGSTFKVYFPQIVQPVHLAGSEYDMAIRLDAFI